MKATSCPDRKQGKERFPVIFGFAQKTVISILGKCRILLLGIQEMVQIAILEYKKQQEPKDVKDASAFFSFGYWILAAACGYPVSLWHCRIGIQLHFRYSLSDRFLLSYGWNLFLGILLDVVIHIILGLGAIF